MRQPKPFFKKSRNTWYVELDGHQFSLGPDEEAAWDQYHQLMAQRGIDGAALSQPDALVIDLCQKFLSWQESHGSPGTYDFYSDPLDSFTKYLGPKKRLRDLKPFHVQEWLDARFKRVSQNYRYNLIRAVKRPFIWARKLGYIHTDPLASVSRGQQIPRRVTDMVCLQCLNPQSGKKGHEIVTGDFCRLCPVGCATGQPPEPIGRTDGSPSPASPVDREDRGSRCSASAAEEPEPERSSGAIPPIPERGVSFAVDVLRRDGLAQGGHPVPRALSHRTQSSGIGQPDSSAGGGSGPQHRPDQVPRTARRAAAILLSESGLSADAADPMGHGCQQPVPAAA